MMNAWWLLVIIPAASVMGFFAHALCEAAKHNWNDPDGR